MFNKNYDKNKYNKNSFQVQQRKLAVIFNAYLKKTNKFCSEITLKENDRIKIFSNQKNNQHLSLCDLINYYLKIYLNFITKYCVVKKNYNKTNPTTVQTNPTTVQTNSTTVQTNPTTVQTNSTTVQTNPTNSTVKNNTNIKNNTPESILDVIYQMVDGIEYTINTYLDDNKNSSNIKFKNFSESFYNFLKKYPEEIYLYLSTTINNSVSKDIFKIQYLINKYQPYNIDPKHFFKNIQTKINNNN